jgi:hypothetical protein
MPQRNERETPRFCSSSCRQQPRENRGDEENVEEGLCDAIGGGEHANDDSRPAVEECDGVSRRSASAALHNERRYWASPLEETRC